MTKIQMLEIMAERLITNNSRQQGKGPLSFDFRGEPVSEETVASRTGFLPIVFHFMNEIDQMSHGGKSTWLENSFELASDSEAVLDVSLVETDNPDDILMAPLSLLMSTAINDYFLDSSKNMFITQQDDGSRKVDLFSTIVDIQAMSRTDAHHLFSIDNKTLPVETEKEMS